MFDQNYYVNTVNVIPAQLKTLKDGVFKKNPFHSYYGTIHCVCHYYLVC